MHGLIRQVFHYFLRYGRIRSSRVRHSRFLLPVPAIGQRSLLIVLTARKPALFWYYALMATLGSAIGCTITDAVSRKLGEAGMEKMANPERVKAVQKRIEKHAWWALGMAALLPPPFPFTVFLIAASGLQMPRWKTLAPVCTGTAGSVFRPRAARREIRAAHTAHFPQAGS